MAAKYPIGIQTFSEIREQGLAYVDKTNLVYKLADGTKYNFLSRPRRFGKSLLVTTLQAYFEGKRELFKDLAIEKMEKEWTQFPVIHLDLSRGKYYNMENLHDTLNSILSYYEKTYSIQPVKSYSTRLISIIQAAQEQANKEVVVLIDEYDAPMLGCISKPDLQAQIRDIILDLLSPLKALEANLRFVFVTGITKFCPPGIFSGLNNINNVSMSDEFAAICGITEEEMIGSFCEGIEGIAKANGISVDKTINILRRQYGGYRFSPHGKKIYNPYSLIKAFNEKLFGKYWLSSATPTFLMELLKMDNIPIPNLEGIYATEDQLDAPIIEQIPNSLSALYQAGYLTIKDYEYGVFTLGFPNEEVREDFYTNIAPNCGLQRTSIETN